jgi:hypothetical protein
VLGILAGCFIGEHVLFCLAWFSMCRHSLIGGTQVDCAMLLLMHDHALPQQFAVSSATHHTPSCATQALGSARACWQLAR